MTNQTYNRLKREWYEQRWAHDDFDDFVEEKYPTVYDYLQIDPLPYSRDMQIILRDWQQTHAPIGVRVRRITARGYSLIPETISKELRVLMNTLTLTMSNRDKWWEDVDRGFVQYSDEAVDAWNDTIHELRRQISEASKHYVEVA